MKARVESFIAQHHLLESGRLVLVALSGGADSVALLLVLHELGYPLEALHCNFHLRGKESDRDCQFAEDLCRQMGVPLKVKHFQTAEYARHHEQSIEMAARELRYEWFVERLHETGAQAVAVGHHVDDQAETLLLNLLRGTGIRGLAAMHPRQGHVVRPLLCTSHADILAYLRDKGQPYVTDSTNLVPDTRRNFIRLHIMPLLSQMQPNAPHALARTASLVQEALPYYQRGVEELMNQAGFAADSLQLESFRRAGSPSLLLHEWLAPYGFNPATTADIARHTECQTGTTWTSATHRVVADRGRLLLRPIHQEVCAPCMRMQTVDAIGHTGPEVAYFDADLITLPLHTRQAQTGDWFVPFGMKGRKLLSDFLTDCKADPVTKAAQYVVCHGEDIIWVVGRRSDNRYRVTASTRRILRIEQIESTD